MKVPFKSRTSDRALHERSVSPWLCPPEDTRNPAKDFKDAQNLKRSDPTTPSWWTRVSPLRHDFGWSTTTDERTTPGQRLPGPKALATGGTVASPARCMRASSGSEFPGPPQRPA